MTTAVAGPRLRRAGRLWPPVVFGLAALLLWELLVRVTGVPAFLLPAPSAIAAQVAASFPTILSTAAVTGGYVALADAIGWLSGRKRCKGDPLTTSVAAVSANGGEGFWGVDA